MSDDGARTNDRLAAERVRPAESRFARLKAKLKRFRERIRANALLDTAWRVGIFVAGWVVVLAGILMLAIPGPGWGAIFLGFAILATEFLWARRALRKAKKVAQDAAEVALDPKVRRRNQIIAGSVVAVAALAVGLYVWFFGVPAFVPFVG